MSHRRGTNLTDAELQTLELMSRGNSNPDIGRLLTVSEDGVKSRIRRIFEKVGAADRAHAVRRGFELGLLHADEAPGGAS